jgi:release factor glutamine methyltransferase
VTVEQGDLYAPLAEMVDRQPFHMIVANPPYIPTGQIDSLDRSVKDYEPISALDGGLDGLTLHRRILEHAADRLLDNGHMFLEIAFDQGEMALEMAGHYPAMTGFKILKDHAGKDRVLAGKKA